MPATSELKWRIAKNLLEKLARKKAWDWSQNDFFQMIGKNAKDLLGTDTMGHWLQSAGGIVAASGLQSPRLAARLLSRATGADEDKLHILLNEVLDAGVMSLVNGIEKGRSNTWVEQQAQAIIDNLDDEFDAIDEEKVILMLGVLHQKHCPACFTPVKGTLKLRPEAAELTYAEAKSRGVDVFAQPNCCRGVPPQEEKKSKPEPKELMAIIVSLRTDEESDVKKLGEGLIKAMQAAERHQVGKLQKLNAEQQDWSKQFVLEALRSSAILNDETNEYTVNLTGFIGFCEMRGKPPETRQQIVATVGALLTGSKEDPTVNRFRASIDEHTANLATSKHARRVGLNRRRSRWEK